MKVWIAAMDVDSFNFIAEEREAADINKFNSEHPDDQVTWWWTKEEAQVEADFLNQM